MNNKYKMFKNFLHNELEISKDDIREWMKEAIQEEAKNVVSQGFNLNLVMNNAATGLIISEGRAWNAPSMSERVAKEIAKNYEFKVKENK